MLHNEVKELLIKAYGKTRNAKEVAECFRVDTSTVYRLEKTNIKHRFNYLKKC